MEGYCPRKAAAGAGGRSRTWACRDGHRAHHRAGPDWANIWKPLIDAFGPVLGEDPSRAFNPYDDRIISLGLHHHVNTGVGHDVIIDAWWMYP
jgi:hypothetical protein